MTADFHELGERAARRGIQVGFEALAWGRHINDYRDAWEVVHRAGHPNVGLVLDSFHTLARKTELDAITAVPSDRIFLVQVADAPLLDMDFLTWSRHYRCFPGQGELPIDIFMDAVSVTRYDGVFSVEICNDRFRAGLARGVAVDGQRSLVNSLDQLQRRTGNAVESLPHLPPRATCLGIEFVEFAMDERSSPAFEETLRGLGFQKAGTHRSKDVTRWRQRDINIVVNREKVGFAHSFNITHGPSVCAITLRVEDARAATGRAVKLLDQPFRQDVASGELDIPAVRGVGGSLIYFVDQKSGPDRLWENGFEPVGDGAASAGLVA